MISTKAFGQLCEKFYGKYIKAKKDVGKTEKLTSSLTTPISKALSDLPGIACRKGCNHCCYLRVSCFPHEIVAIYTYLNRVFSKTELKRIKGKIAEQYTQVNNLGVEALYTTNIRCPLLRNQKCIAYPVRPLACAGYHSMSEQKCRESFENPHVVGTETGGIAQLKMVAQQHDIQNSVVVNVARHLKDDSGQYELISALNGVFNNPKTIRRWIKGKKAHPGQPIIPSVWVCSLKP